MFLYLSQISHLSIAFSEPTWKCWNQYCHQNYASKLQIHFQSFVFQSENFFLQTIWFSAMKIHEHSHLAIIVFTFKWNTLSCTMFFYTCTYVRLIAFWHTKLLSNYTFLSILQENWKVWKDNCVTNFFHHNSIAKYLNDPQMLFLQYNISCQYNRD